jgi:AAA domain
MNGDDRVFDGVHANTAKLNCADWDQIPYERIRWLLLDRMPFAEVTAVEGPGGLGKTTWLLDLAARITTARPMPDGTPVAIGDVLLIAEEDRSFILKARLEAARADISRVHLIASVGENRERLSLPTHARAIHDGIEEHHASFVVIDNLFSHFDRGLKPNVPEDARLVVDALNEVAHATGAAIPIIRHWGKEARSATSRGLGSAEILNACRAGLTVGRHPFQDDGPVVIAVSKANLAKRPPDQIRSLTYRLEERVVTGNDVTVEVGGVAWGDECEVTADNLATFVPEGGEKATMLTAAVEYLRLLLADGPVPTKEVLAEMKTHGFGAEVCYRARNKARIISIPMMGDSPHLTAWALPPQPTKSSDKGETESSPRREPVDENQNFHSPHNPKGESIESIESFSSVDLATRAHARDHTKYKSIESIESIEPSGTGKTFNTSTPGVYARLKVLGEGEDEVVRARFCGTCDKLKIHCIIDPFDERLICPACVAARGETA